MSAWPTVALGNAGTWISGGTPSTSVDAYWGGAIPWMSSKSLTAFKVRDSDRRLTPLGADNGTRLVPPNTILMVVRGMSLKTVFRMGITEREVALSQDLKALLPASEFDPLFLAYAIRSRSLDVLDMVDEAGHGTGRLQTDRLFSLELPLPQMREQRGIAATLGALDDKIESNRRIIRTAGDLLDVLSGSLAGMLGSVPLAKLVTVGSTAVVPASLTDAQVDHFSLPAFDNGALPVRVMAATIMSGKLAVTNPTILVSRLNPRFNRTWWALPTPGIPAMASTEFACLTAGSREDLAAIWLAVREEYFRTELVQRATGTSGSHQRVRLDDLPTIDVPDIRELTPSVKSEALALLDLIHHHRLQSVSVAKLRDTLLPELLSGRIRVPEAREAVEEVTG